MSITIEQLAMYLPYGLEIFLSGEKYYIHGYERDSLLTSPKKGYVPYVDMSHTAFSAAKPIVYPLSHLTKPIVVEGTNGGEPFIPIEALKIFTHLEYEYIGDDWLNLVVDGLMSVNLLNSPLGAIQMLTSWHLWIFDQSYFEKGLLIDKSTI